MQARKKKNTVHKATSKRYVKHSNLKTVKVKKIVLTYCTLCDQYSDPTLYSKFAISWANQKHVINLMNKVEKILEYYRGRSMTVKSRIFMTVEISDKDSILQM